MLVIFWLFLSLRHIWCAACLTFFSWCINALFICNARIIANFECTEKNILVAIIQLCTSRMVCCNCILWNMLICCSNPAKSQRGVGVWIRLLSKTVCSPWGYEWSIYCGKGTFHHVATVHQLRWRTLIFVDKLFCKIFWHTTNLQNAIQPWLSRYCFWMPSYLIYWCMESSQRPVGDYFKLNFIDSKASIFVRKSMSIDRSRWGRSFQRHKFRCQYIGAL